MENPFLSIIVPAYNEAERIPAALEDMDKRLNSANFTYEILVMNDGSRDNTLAIVRGMANRIKNLKVVDLGKNQGKGAAVRAGMLQATGEYRIFTDADNSTSIDQCEAMFPLLKSGYGVVIGSRAIKGAKLEPAEPWHRRLIGRTLNFAVQLLIVPGIWDTQCGFKAFTAETAERVFTMSKIKGWGFDVEALALANALGYRMKEIPVRWVNDERSHMTLSGGLKFILEVIKIRWALWMNAYGLK